MGEGPTLTSELEIGPRRRKVWVIDDVIEARARSPVFALLRDLPYRFADFDRPDTTAVRHLVHYFEPSEYATHPVLRRMSRAATDFLASCGHRVTGIERMYANFNLFGDFQFAHTDGDVWTALAFVNAEWSGDFGGELLLYDADAPRAPAWAIAPEPGRMVIFDGHILHRGGVPSKHCLDPRISVAMKLERRMTSARPGPRAASTARPKSKRRVRP